MCDLFPLPNRGPAVTASKTKVGAGSHGMQSSPQCGRHGQNVRDRVSPLAGVLVENLEYRM